MLFDPNSEICRKSSDVAHTIIVADAITNTRLNLFTQGIVVVLNLALDPSIFPVMLFTPILFPNLSHRKEWENIPPMIATSDTIKGHLINPSVLEVTATVWTRCS